ncbi:hypothetical protein GF312_13590 [Candidatus Poribacteria bacterium]|nr:hypothetical protein [Candidatus Poribacteria bacterium]
MLCKRPNCNAYTIKNDEFCYWHSKNPEIIRARTEASSKGGKAGKNKPLREDKPIESITDIRQIMTETINDLRAFRIDPTQARAINSMCSNMLKIIEICDLVLRLEALEGIVENIQDQEPDI